MAPEDLMLRWSNHGKSLSTVFRHLRESSSLVDCTLSAGGQYMQAHRLVLSACSPYFEKLFKDIEGKHPVIVLKDVKYQELTAVVDFMYCGEVGIPQEQLQPFLAAAECLQIKELLGVTSREVANDKVLEQRNLVSSQGRRDGGSPTSPASKKRRSVPHEEDAPAFEFVAVDNVGNQGTSTGSPFSAQLCSDEAAPVPTRFTRTFGVKRDLSRAPPAASVGRAGCSRAKGPSRPSATPPALPSTEGSLLVPETIVKTELLSDDFAQQETDCEEVTDGDNFMEDAEMDPEHDFPELTEIDQTAEYPPAHLYSELSSIAIESSEHTPSDSPLPRQGTDQCKPDGGNLSCEKRKRDWTREQMEKRLSERYNERRKTKTSVREKLLPKSETCCKCCYNCHDIPFYWKLKLFNDCHAMQTEDEQLTYLLPFIHITAVKSRRHGTYTDPANSRRQCTISYHIPDTDGGARQVCRATFQDIYGIKNSFLEILRSRNKQIMSMNAV